MRFFFGLLLIFHSVFSISGYDASVCTGLRITLASFIPTGNQYIFKYFTDITLNAADESHTTLTFKNQNTWTLDKGNYFQWSPIQFLNDVEIVKCPAVDGPCTLKIYDSLGLLQIPLAFNGSYKDVVLNQNLFIDQGTVFLSNSKNFAKTSFLNKTSPCILTDGSAIASKKNDDMFLDIDYVTTVKYCCTQFEDLPTPNTHEICQQLDGNTVFYDSNGKSVADVSYSAAPDYYIYNLGSNATANYLPSDSRFMARLNYNSAKECDYFSLDTETCNLGIPFDENVDIQANLQLTVLSNEFSYPPYGPVIAGKIIYRNGGFVKNYNEYTSNDPCWNRSIPLTNGVTAKNSLCCSKFLKTTCSSYRSISNESDYNANVFLDLTYVFTDTSFILTINNYLASLNSTVTVKSFSYDTSTQTCQASTDYPRNSCTLKLSKTQTYDISFGTSITRDYPVQTIIYDGSQVISPPVTPKQPCPVFWSDTYFCCVTN